MKVFYIATTTILLSLAQSCSSVTPHENFKNHMQMNVAKKINDSKTLWVRPQYLVDIQLLENSNTENKYRFRGSCVYFFEIEKNTNIIVGWRFEGSEKDCSIAP